VGLDTAGIIVSLLSRFTLTLELSERFREGNMTIRTGTGNILDANVDALVNPVNTVRVMGAGLARQFRHRWPEMFEEYRVTNLTIGKIHVWKTGQEVPKFVVNLPTKEHWRDPSKMIYVTAGLKALVEAVSTHGICSLAVPALGCGLGGLLWEDVRREIVTELDALPIDVFLWEPRSENGLR
jgi:O-acetyl-ADP-ribose deacetylase (regulator of RNase III)